MNHLRILIGDDSESMRIIYKRILESRSNLRVVAMASNGEEAVARALESKPDVAVLDIGMPRLDGIKVAHRIRAEQPDTAVVVVSAFDDLSYVAELMQNGSARKGYLLKGSLLDFSELIRIVETVERGHTVLDQAIVHKMARLYCKHSGLLGPAFTEIEQDLLGFMAEGYDDAYIFRTAGLSQQQVQGYLSTIYEKLHIHESTGQDRRGQAVRAFVDQIHKVPLAVTAAPTV